MLKRRLPLGKGAVVSDVAPAATAVYAHEGVGFCSTPAAFVHVMEAIGLDWHEKSMLT